MTESEQRTALVTGASGYVGGELVPRLLDEGWRVRVLTRHASSVAGAAWAAPVEVVEGDAEGVQRIVYLGGLHPDDEELSPHLASRVEVGEIFLAAPVPAAVLQAAVVLGDGSISFQMLRYLSDRLPVMLAPRWLRNRIQPIAIADLLHYLLRAADLPAESNRSFDVGGPEVLTYADMIRRFAAVTGLRSRWVVTVPVLTPGLASRWIGLVTPLNTKVARPLVDSLIHEVVCRDDADEVLGAPATPTGFDDAVRAAMIRSKPDPFTVLRR